MITEDFIIANEWVEIPVRVGGTFVYIADVQTNNVVVIIGNEVSTSSGLILRAATDSLKVQDTVFIKTNRLDRTALVTIIRD